MKGSAHHTMTFRVQVRLNSLIHPDAIALLHSVPKEDLAEVMATILQHGAMVQRSINSGNSVLKVAPMNAASKGEQSAPWTGDTKSASPQSATAGVANPNPLAAAGFDMERAAEAFAIPGPRTH